MQYLIVFVLALATSVSSRGRILGGDDAVPTNFKYLARIFVPTIDGAFLTDCGGSIINKNWILTAAHCFDGGQRNRTETYLGLMRDRLYTQVRHAVNVIIHESYYNDGITITSDIALIQIADVEFNNYTESILMSPTVLFDGQNVRVAGWGRTGNTTDFPSQLQYTTLRVLNSTGCQEKIGRNIPETQFCTFAETSSTCFGDSGSPAIMGSGSTARQVGFVSYSLAICSPNTPGGYTRVSSFLPWIESKTNITNIANNN